MQKLHNEEILAKAELIRCYRVAELINRNIGYIGPEKRNRDFLDYFKKATLKHPQTWQSAYLHFYRFSKEHCLFGDLDFQIISFASFHGRYTLYALKAWQDTTGFFSWLLVFAVLFQVLFYVLLLVG